MSLRLASVVFVVNCLAQLSYPASMIVGYERTLRTGTPIRVRCQAVDPADLLRGRYVRLRLETLTTRVERPVEYPENAKVFALLEPDTGGFARLRGIRDRAPETGLYLPAQVRAVNAETGEVTVGLTFDRYYMEEYEAPRAETAFRRSSGEGGAFVVLRVRAGRGVIEDLIVDGRPIAELLSDPTH
jgi:uncharacterized membrane-anchored protein